MFCPQCRTEYREGFETCTDCGVALVSELPPEPAREYLEFEEILISLNPGDIAMIKSLLDSEGITYYFRGESSYPLGNKRDVGSNATWNLNLNGKAG